MREQIKLDAGVVSLVELGRSYAGRVCGALAVNRQVIAEGIALGAVGVGRGVERDDLVSQHIVAWGNILRNSDEPAVVIVGEHVSCPQVASLVDPASLADLKELEFGLVDSFLGDSQFLAVLFFSRPVIYGRGKDELTQGPLQFAR